MIRFRLGRDDALRTRFALSPLHELQWAVEVVRDPARRSIHLPWARWAAPRAERIEASVDLLHSLLAPPGGYVPDFIAPPPETPLPDVAAEIERVAATPPETARRELQKRFERGDTTLPKSLVEDPPTAIAQIAAAQRT